MGEGDRDLVLLNDSDPEKMQQNLMRLMFESENWVFTVQMAHGTIMHINITSEQEPCCSVSARSTWCISTLIIHNNQQYTRTIHNITVSPDLMFNVGLPRQLDSIEDSVHLQSLLRQMVMGPPDLLQQQSLQMPTAVIQSHPAQATAYPQLNPACLLHGFMQYYCDYVMRTARILDNVFSWVSQPQGSRMGALMQDMYTRYSLQMILNRMRRSLRVAEVIFLASQVQTLEDMIDESGDETGEESDEDLTTDLDDVDSEIEETETCAPDSVYQDDHDDQEMQDDGDSTSADSDDRPSALLSRNFQELCLLNSSEEDNEQEQADDVASETENDETFEAYLVRQLRAHASSMATRLNSVWARSANETAPAEANDSEMGSCDMNGDIEDMRSEQSYNAEDLDASQINEDRGFETELSRPFRRLVGDLPAQTAHEERLALRQSQDNHGREFRPVPSNRHIPETGFPLALYNHLRSQQNLATTQLMMEAGILARNRRARAFGLQSRVDRMTTTTPANTTEGEDSYDQDHEHETKPVPDSDSDAHEMELPSQVEHTVPLQMFIQQTDELIAQLWSNLNRTRN